MWFWELLIGGLEGFLTVLGSLWFWAVGAVLVWVVVVWLWWSGNGKRNGKR